MFPPSVRELVPADHPARAVAAFVDSLSDARLAEVGVKVGGDRQGAPSYDVRALLSVWLLGFMSGVRSARRLEYAVRNELAYMWLSGVSRPDHNTLWRFYRKHRQGMRELIRDTVQMAVDVGLVDLAIQAVDGTKIQADVSDFRRAKEAKEKKNKGVDQEKLSKAVEEKIEDLERQNKEEIQAGPCRLPCEYEDAEHLRERVGQAVKEMAEERRLKKGRVVDADATTMKVHGGFATAYNAQATVSPLRVEGVETGGLLITAADVSANPTDYDQLIPMIEQAEKNTGAGTTVTVADAGYWKGQNLAQAREKKKVVYIPDPSKPGQYHRDSFEYDEDRDVYICPNGHELTYRGKKKWRTGELVRKYSGSAKTCRECPAFGKCTKNEKQGRGLEVGEYCIALREQRKRMKTPEAEVMVRRRKGIVEPVFGILKVPMGMRRFLLRGLGNVQAEWTWLAIAFNLRSTWRLLRRMPPDSPARLRWANG